jgi:hypothetical protein
MKYVAKEEAKKQFSENEKKWTRTLMQAGFTVLPSVILERQQALGLDPIDVNILLHLARYWWYAENRSSPFKKSDCRVYGCRHQHRPPQNRRHGERRFDQEGGSV